MPVLPTIIGGGGPGGLALACLLGRAGHPFVLLEKRVPGTGIDDIGAHGSRPNIGLWHGAGLRVLEDIGIPTHRYAPFPEKAGVHAAIGRVERDAADLVLAAGGDVRFGQRITALHQHADGTVSIGIGGTSSRPDEWVHGSEFANFTGGRTGAEAAQHMERADWPGSKTFTSFTTTNEPDIDRRFRDATGLRGVNTVTDGAYMVQRVPAGATDWAERIRTGARAAGFHGVELVPPGRFTTQQSVATRAWNGQGVLSGGDTIARKDFFEAAGGNLAVVDAAHMADAILTAAARPSERPGAYALYGEAAIRRHTQVARRSAERDPDLGFPERAPDGRRTAPRAQRSRRSRLRTE